MEKIKIAIIVTALVVSAFLFDRFTAANSETINMNKVADIQATEYGIQITFADGNGYYWER